MSEKKTGWRAWAAASVFVVLLIGGLWITRPFDSPPAPAPTTTPIAAVPRPSIVAQPPPPLGRAELVAAADEAASRYAAEEPPPAELLAGRRFVVNLPFGCSGPVEELDEARRGWTYDPETETLRVRVEPQQWTEAPFAEAILADVPHEEVEGFWIDRPWSRVETCPRTPDPAPSPAIPPQVSEAPAKKTPPAADPQAIRTPPPMPLRQTLALMEVFEPGTRRAKRRGGRAYLAVRSVDASEIALERGLRLRVEGRLAALGDRPPIGCWSESPTLRPVCAVRVRFERIAITDASGEQLIAEWRD